MFRFLFYSPCLQTSRQLYLAIGVNLSAYSILPACLKYSVVKEPTILCTPNCSNCTTILQISKRRMRAKRPGIAEKISQIPGLS